VCTGAHPMRRIGSLAGNGLLMLVDHYFTAPGNYQDPNHVCVDVAFNQVEGVVEITLREGYPLPGGTDLREPVQYTIFLPSEVTYDISDPGAVHATSFVSTPDGLVDYWYVPTSVGDWYRGTDPLGLGPFAAEVALTLQLAQRAHVSVVKSWAERNLHGPLKVIRIEDEGRQVTVVRALEEGLAMLDFRSLVGPGGHVLAPPRQLWIHAPNTYELLSWQPKKGEQSLGTISLPGRPG